MEVRTVVKAKWVIELTKRHLNRILTIAEAALPPPQFRAFRKATLDEFGRSGFEKEIMDMAEGRVPPF
ncbi:MAG: hypothetical protein HQL69_15035 [Magnetococcales bacterium]|nr:hypothetical protein [Magnetococcales bacterium]